MLKKPYIILYLILTLVLLSSFVSATLLVNLTDGLAHVWNFEETSGKLTDKIDNTNSTTVNITSRTATGINGNAWDFEEENKDVIIMDNRGLIEGGGARTVSIWFKVETFNETFGNVLYSYGGSGPNDRWMMGTNNQKFPSMDFSGAVLTASRLLVVDSWYMMTTVYNSTGTSAAYLYLNGTFITTSDVALSTGTNEPHIISRQPFNDGRGWFDGLIDEIYVWNRSLNGSEINALWNNSKGFFYPFIEEVEAGITLTPTIVAPSPVDNSNNNTNVTLNVTHSTTNNDVTYYLYFGDTTPLGETDLYQNNVSRTGDEYASFVTNVSDGVYFWKWRVQNTTSGIFSGNTTQRTLTIDTVIPTITISANTSFKIDNSTIISNYINNLTINISFFDTNLFQTLINITNESDNSVFQILNTSITGTTANYSRLIDITGWAIGNYTVKLIVTDSHTTNSIRKYDVKTGINYFRYTTKEGNVIKITSNNFNLFTKSTTKLKDRYDFEFNYLFQQDTYTFIIESYNKIEYIEDSDYNAHFVIMGGNGKGNWIDFNNPNLASKDYKVTKIDDYIYEVEVTANGIKNFKFSSLGGLNRVEQDFLLRIGAVIDVWSFDADNGTAIPVTAVIGNQVAHSTVGVSGARLVNITKEIIEVTLNSTGYGIEAKTISITQSLHNFTLNLTVVNAVKLSFFDERSEALIVGETFSVFLEKTGFSQIFSGITDNPHSITGLDGGLYKLKASSSNYPERQYLDLSISDVTTTFLNVYLINDTIGSERTFNIVSEDGLTPLDNVRTVFTKIINGTKTVVAEEESDFAGQVVLELDPNTLYTINFSKTNFEDKTINLEPKNSAYVIQMVSTVGAYNQSVHEGIRYSFSPQNTILNNKTEYNFTFTLNSTVWPVTACTLNLKNGSILLSSTSGFVSTGCFLRIEQNTESMTNITSEAIYEINSQSFTVSQQYSVIFTYQGEFSLMSFLDDISDFSMAGFDGFGRMILAFIVIFVILGITAIKIGIDNKEALIFIFWALLGFFSFVGWFTLELDTMPDILGLKQYFIFYLFSLVGVGFVWNKIKRAI